MGPRERAAAGRVPEGPEARAYWIVAVVVTPLAVGLCIFMPLGAVVAFASAFWIRQPYTCTRLLIIGIALTCPA